VLFVLFAVNHSQAAQTSEITEINPSRILLKYYLPLKILEGDNLQPSFVLSERLRSLPSV
jgi:hypothetical protein